MTNVIEIIAVQNVTNNVIIVDAVFNSITVQFDNLSKAETCLRRKHLRSRHNNVYPHTKLASRRNVLTWPQIFI